MAKAVKRLAKQKNIRKVIKITQTDKALFCPPENKPLWSNHPRVYLPLDSNMQATCPYCGNQYKAETSK